MSKGSEFKHISEWEEGYEDITLPDGFSEFIHFAMNCTGIVAVDDFKIDKDCNFDNLLVEDMWFIWREGMKYGIRNAE